MNKNLKYRFFIFEENEPRMDVKPPYEVLFDLSNGFIGTVNGVSSVIENIEKVISGEMNSYVFGGSDFVIIGVSNTITTITSFFEDEEKIQDIPTEEILALMKDWLNYLINFKLEQGR